MFKIGQTVNIIINKELFAEYNNLTGKISRIEIHTVNKRIIYYIDRIKDDMYFYENELKLIRQCKVKLP